MPILNVRSFVDVFFRLAELPPGALGDYRTINAPSIAPAVSEIAVAVLRIGRPGIGEIRFAPDPAVARIVAGWPQAMRAERAEQLGLSVKLTIESVIEEHLESIRKA
jgi:nucleoside-diphosphate-sugar epimerase